MKEPKNKEQSEMIGVTSIKSTQEIRRQRSLYLELETLPILKNLSERYPIMDMNDLVHKLFKIGLLTVERYGLEESINRIAKLSKN